MAEELVKSEQVADENSASDDENWENWMPDPVNADPSTFNKKNPKNNIT